MPSTHVLTANGRISIPLDESLTAVQISSVLHHLDGTEHFSIALWRTPASARIDFRPVVEYLQAAGSAARMTVEMSALIDGIRHHWVVGRRGQRRTSDGAKVAIGWDGHATTVRAYECFDADEAADVFVYYLHHAGVGPEYQVRPLTMP